MSIQWMDNFNMYGGSTGNMLDGTPWVSMHGAPLITDPDPNASGLVLEPRNGNSSAYQQMTRLALPTPSTTVGVAFRLYVTSLPEEVGGGSMLSFRTTANIGIYNLLVMPNGSLRIYDGDGLGTVLADTVSPVIFAGAWNHLEMLVNTVSGEIEFYREGIPVTSLTVTDPGPGSANVSIIGMQPYVSGFGSSADDTMRVKDLVVYDGSGTENNSQIGPVVVYNLLVDGDVSSGWVPSSGTSDAALIGVEDPDDANFITADDTPPAPSIMTFQDLPEDIVAVRALMPLIRMMKTDGGDAQVQMSLDSGASSDAGADRTLTTAFTYYWDVSELDPDTAAVWTPIAVNNAEISVNRTV